MPPKKRNSGKPKRSATQQAARRKKDKEDRVESRRQITEEKAEEETREREDSETFENEVKNPEDKPTKKLRKRKRKSGEIRTKTTRQLAEKRRKDKERRPGGVKLQICEEIKGQMTRSQLKNIKGDEDLEPNEFLSGPMTRARLKNKTEDICTKVNVESEYEKEQNDGEEQDILEVAKKIQSKDFNAVMSIFENAQSDESSIDLNEVDEHEFESFLK